MKRRITYDTYAWHYLATHPWQLLKDCWEKLGWYWQRALYGYCDVDLWCLSGYLNRLLASALHELAEHHCGYPPSITDEQWTRILREMAEGFGAGCRVDDMQYRDRARAEELYAQHERALVLFKKWYWHLWD